MLLGQWKARFNASVGLVVVWSACLVCTHAAASDFQLQMPADFERCQRIAGDEPCLEQLDALVQRRPDDAMAAGKVVRRQFNADVAMRYFSVAAKRTPIGFCKDADLVLSMQAGLALPPDYDNAGRARTVFQSTCFDALQADVLRRLATPDGQGYYKDNVCAVLKQRKVVDKACSAPLESAASSATTKVAESVSLPTIDKASMKLGKVSVLEGAEGERVTIAEVVGTSAYLIRMENISGPWNGKTMLHVRDDLGHGEGKYWTVVDGSRWISIVQRSGWEAYAPGSRYRDGFRIRYHKGASEAVDRQALVEQYQP